MKSAKTLLQVKKLAVVPLPVFFSDISSPFPSDVLQDISYPCDTNFIANIHSLL